MMRVRYAVFGGLVAVVLTARAEAQQSYPIQEMNFDMWCQEEQHLAPERCDKRLPQDDADFNAYRATIEKYEIPYLQQKQQDENLNRVIIHGDPIDHPAEPSTSPAAAAGSTPCSGVLTCSVAPPQNPGGTSPAGASSTPQQ